MGEAAILFMWPGPFKQTFVPASYGDSIWNLSLIDNKGADQNGHRRSLISAFITRYLERIVGQLAPYKISIF